MGLSQMKSTLLSKFLLFSIIPVLAFCEDFFVPLKMPNFDANKAELGKKIFRDTKFNKDKLSCDSCHNLYLNSSGASTKDGEIPTILNAYYIERFMGEKRFSSLEERIRTSIFSKKELNSSQEIIEEIITQNLTYKREFNKLYGKINLENFIDALAQYLKSKTTINSKFDQALRNETTLDESETKGYLFFIEYCSHCHNGANLGTNSYALVANKNTYKSNNRTNNSYRAFTSKRVASLRNITKTAPYTNGEYSLEKAVRLHFKNTFNYTLRNDDAANLLSFLATL